MAAAQPHHDPAVETARDWRTSGRPRLASGHRIYAVGDIHGRIDLLTVLVARIVADLRRFPVDQAELVFLGDYISRGPGSPEVLEFMLSQAPALPLGTRCLKGNHEDMLLRFVDKADLWAGSGWLRFGGKAVFSAYGLIPPQSLEEPQLVEAAALLRDAMPDRHLDFLRGLPAAYECDDYLFVHGGLRPGVPMAEQTAHDMMWIREEFLNHTGLFERFIVHGHTPASLPDIRRNRLNVDTKAYASGVLTAAVVEGPDQRFLSSL